MLKAQAYEANLYWRCPKCGYEHNTMWFYDGDSSYKFTCGGCGEDVLVSPPKSDTAEAVEQPLTQAKAPAEPTPEGEICQCCTGDGIGADESGWVSCTNCGGTGKLPLA